MKHRIHFTSKRIAVLAVLFVTLTIVSCKPRVPVEFKAVYNPTIAIDTVTFEGWSLGNLVKKNTAVFYPTPSNIQNGQYEELPIFIYEGIGNVSSQDAFRFLSSDYDSVRFTRSSDAASTITYCHDENATENQCFFFKRESWTCNPDAEGYEGTRTYTFNLTDDMFH